MENIKIIFILNNKFKIHQIKKKKKKKNLYIYIYILLLL